MSCDNLFMKTKYIITFVLFFCLSACQPATPPPPFDATVGESFTLAPGGMAHITDAGYSVTLISVGNDERCPANIECAVSGPVAVSISIQKDASTPAQFDMQTFTSEDGMVPKFAFEGIRSEVEYEGYTIGIVSVLPYPQEFNEKITPKDYRVTFVVLK